MTIRVDLIEPEKLGILEPLIREYATLEKKRSRSIKFRELAQLLVKLRLTVGRPFAIGIGFDSAGSQCAIVATVEGEDGAAITAK